ncbi:MFS transporter [Priestia megaterium]|uniref:MFS transporter n=1 Tax=Priestia megaterium TaxID=1404 RepID=UPI00366F8E38
MKVNSNVTVLFTISLLFFISITAFDPFVSSFAAELELKPALIGSIIGAAGLTSLFTRLPVGILSEVFFKRKLFIQLGLLLTIIAWTAAFLSPNAVTLYLAKITDGLTGSTWVVYNVLFASYFGLREAAKAVAVLSIASPAGSLIGVTIGGIVSNNYGYKYSFLVAIIAAVIAICLTLFLKEQPGPQNKPKYSPSILIEQITDKKIWYLAILTAITLMILYGTRDTFTPIVAKDLGANPFIIGWLSNTHLILYGLATALCGPYFYKKLGLVNTAVVGAIMQGLVAIAIPFAPSLMYLFMLQAIMGFAFGMNYTVFTSLAIANTIESKQSTRIGLFQSLYSLGQFFGPVIMGILIQSFSREFSFLSIGLTSIIAAFVTLFLLKTPSVVKSEEKKIEVS